MTSPQTHETISYSRFACIGAGFSAIGLGATLKRWYNIDDVAFFERHDKLGGTWFINQYPGAACDVPSALYSYSFEPNSGWTRILPSQNELWEYLNNVALKYDLKKKMSFGINVECCEWIEESARWRMTLRHIKSDTTLIHESQFLFCATGQLVKTRDIDIPGAETFKGPIFHTARWRRDVDLRGKNVVVFGNGCTAAQVVPSIVKETNRLTQFVRAKHWILPPIDAQIRPWMNTVLKWFPALMGWFRFAVFVSAETNLRGFPLTEAAHRYRARKRVAAEKYMRSTAPVMYHDLLIPDFEVGCKRRIFDSGYLKSLHEENLVLTNDKPLEIVPDGVRTAKGIVEADTIILANGFVTNEFLIGLDVKGKSGITLQEHWNKFGGSEAYNCSVLSNFPNMFILLGPNAATGHTSAIMAAENSINYALRVIKPVLDGEASIVNLKDEAERDYSDHMQASLRNTVWNSGCQSWYVTRADGDSDKTWNAMSYPWSQAHFWYRSLFPVWSDWTYRMALEGPASGKSEGMKTVRVILIITAIVGSLLALGLPGDDRQQRFGFENFARWVHNVSWLWSV